MIDLTDNQLTNFRTLQSEQWRWNCTKIYRQESRMSYRYGSRPERSGVIFQANQRSVAHTVSLRALWLSLLCSLNTRATCVWNSWRGLC